MLNAATNGSHERDHPEDRKRLRLGTRSCTECRRRRVRCVYPQEAHACEACLLHNTPCRAQQGTETRQAEQLTDGTAATLKQRLATLESQLESLKSFLSADQMSLVKGQTEAQSSSHDQFQTNPACASHNRVVPVLVEARAMRSASSAPLMKFVRDSIGTQTVEDGVRPAEGAGRANVCVQDALRKLNHGLDVHGLRSILVATEPYWTIWPPYYYGTTTQDRIKSGDVEAAMEHILNSLNAINGAEIAKALLWIALCLQQLPPHWTKTHCALSASSRALVQSYMSIAKTILAIDAEEETSSVCQIECHLFEYKLLINMGKARRAWHTIRDATSLGLLLGLHYIDTRKEDWRRDVWSQVCQADVLLSLVLGFPVAIPVSSFEPCPEDIAQGNQKDLQDEMLALATAVIRRDQEGRRHESYAATMQLDEAWQQCRAMIPADWWDCSLDANLGFEVVYNRQVVKLLAALIGKHIHLPYVVRARSDARFRYSHHSIMTSCKQIMQAYLTLRRDLSTRLVMCELMDFHAFGAALTVAVELLSRSSGATGEEEDELWFLVESLAATLRQTSANLECGVAAQGARVLEILFAVCRRPESAPKEFEAVIPYFGKIHITGTKKLSEAGLSSTVPDDALQQKADGVSTPSNFEVAVDIFDFAFLGDLPPAADLDSQWADLSWFELET